jgi:hypothetical protein
VGRLSTRGWVVTTDPMQPFYTRRMMLLTESFTRTLMPCQQAELACLQCLLSAHGGVWYAQAKRRMLAMLEEDE